MHKKNAQGKTILDIGAGRGAITFHNYVKCEEQKQYIEKLSRLLSDQGVLFIYFCSEHNERDEVENPYYYSREAVYELFKKQFVILSCEEFELYNDEKEFIFNAFFCIMRKNMVVIK